MDPLKPNITNFNDKKQGNFKANAPCKNHPKHRQSPGVCSICLRERLSKLPNVATSSSSSSKVGVSSSVSSSCSDLSSSNASSCSSPVANYTCRVEYLEAGKSMKVFKNVGQDVLKKSRSMAYVLQRRNEGFMDDNNGKNIAVKRGFWSKLLPRRGKGLRYSRTMRERAITEVH